MTDIADTSGQSALPYWLARRLLRALGQCLLASMALFGLIQLLPGDAASALAGRSGPDAVEELRQRMGLNRPLPERYLNWLAELLHGDLGTTLVSGQPVVEVIATPVLATATVAVIVLAGLLILTLPAAVWAGARPAGLLARVASGTTVALAAIPEFVVAIGLLALLSYGVQALPVLSIPGAGRVVWDNPVCLVMPSLCLWLICSASLFRRVQSLVATYAKAAYVRDAELAGLSIPKVLFAHLLPSAGFGIGQLFAQTVPYLLGGTVVVETVTAFPGLGYTLVQAVNAREAPVVMAIGVLLVVVTVVAFTIADAVGRGQERVVAVA